MTRFSRDFFQTALAGELQGSIQIGLVEEGERQSRAARFEGLVVWTEGPVEALPSGEHGPVLGDFRDRQGCAVFQRGQSSQAVPSLDVALCFLMMGDVWSLGINERELEARHLAKWVEAQLGPPCPGSSWKVRLIGGTLSPERGTPSRVKVRFLAEPPRGCSVPSVPIELELKRS